MPEVKPEERIRQLNELVEKYRNMADKTLLEVKHAKQLTDELKALMDQKNREEVKRIQEMNQLRATLFELGQSPWAAGSIMIKAIFNMKVSWRTWVAISIIGVFLLNLLVGSLFGMAFLYWFATN